MIEVDISNIWGRVSLPDLLGQEARVAAAHNGLAPLPELPGEETVAQLLAAAERICQGDALVVLGSCLEAQGSIRLLRGRGGPELLFAGSSLSTRAWKALMDTLEGKDFSICVAEKSLEAAIAFRSLRWMLERKYGTDAARQRLFAAAGEKPWDEGWTEFALAPGAMALLPMAVAGLDIRAYLDGVRQAREEFDLRSYENPVWLYAGVRTMLCRSGRIVEVLETGEPDLADFGRWWQRCFGSCPGPFPVLGEQLNASGEHHFVTALGFTMEAGEMVIGADAKDLEGINALAGRSLDTVREQVWQSTLDGYVDKGVPVLCVDCGVLNEKTLGQLDTFFRLSRDICAAMA